MYELSNVPAAGVWVVDARYTDRAALVSNETQLQADGTYRARFVANNGGTGKYVVTPVGQENKPISINLRQVRPVRLNGVYLATGPAQFGAGVMNLLKARTKEGVRGQYVDQEQLFDYYNFGRFGPDGIRKAVRSVKPQYLLLLGRTTYDYRNYSGLNVDPLCPTFLVPTSFWAQATSDSAFGDLGRGTSVVGGYPEIAVGRLPVNNAAELNVAVSRILGYAGLPVSGTRVHAVSDQDDPAAGNFGAQLDGVADANTDVSWQRNYLGATYQTTQEVTLAMQVAANGGADLLLYAGHGSASHLGAAQRNILGLEDVQMWTGNTVFLQSTCTANWMAKNEDGYKSIAIQALTQPQGGISANIASSTYMNSDAAVAFMKQLMQNTKKSAKVRWGTALLQAQQWAYRQGTGGFYRDLSTTEQIFGDPAMPVYAPGAKPGTGTTGGGSVTPVNPTIIGGGGVQQGSF